MSEANESVNYRIQERGRNEWIVRRVDEANKLLELYRIVRIDAGLELKECKCGRSDQRGSMCLHILACIKEARVRRNLLKVRRNLLTLSFRKISSSRVEDSRPPERCQGCCKWRMSETWPHQADLSGLESFASWQGKSKHLSRYLIGISFCLCKIPEADS